jgi:calnexin
MSEYSSHHALCTLQYDVRFQKEATCGGAYLKVVSSGFYAVTRSNIPLPQLISSEAAFDGESLTDKTPFTILFGPDKCGATARLLFIFRHKSPVTGQYREVVAKDIDGINAKIFNRRSHLLTLGTY